uniref:Protein TIC 214 n=1 Tax=Epipremnum aureum TaxID=78380 RepID=A0A0M4B4A7_9ARAE|nr:ycf1 [Epipremnum aureum]ALB38642.1 ycf1 [Epipremnum aureum]
MMIIISYNNQEIAIQIQIQINRRKFSMILKFVLLGDALSKITNSAVIVGLYYGFLTVFSTGPFCLFFLRTLVLEQGEDEQTATGVGLIMGQFFMLVSIYYTPLHLILDRPHTITALVIPYLFLNFFWNNNRDFVDYVSTTRNPSIRKLNIQCIILNNIVFQLLNHFVLPSSTLARLLNIYMFRCNDKILFITGAFFSLFIIQILFIKWLQLVVFWIWQSNYIKPNRYIILEFKDNLVRFFNILLFITCLFYFGRKPFATVPLLIWKRFTNTSKEVENEEEPDVQITREDFLFGKGSLTPPRRWKMKKNPTYKYLEKTWVTITAEEEYPHKINETLVNGKEKTKDEFHFNFNLNTDSLVNGKEKTKDEFHFNFNLNTDSYQEQEFWKLDLESKEKQYHNLYWFEKPLITLLFDYRRWVRPFRYKRNAQFENPVRDEMSQYFFYTCPSDGKQKISFTYPPSLSTFSEMIEQKISLYTTEELSHEDNSWVYTNEQKKHTLSNELINRIKTLEKKKRYHVSDVLEKRIRLCDDKDEMECLPKPYDPLLNGPYRRKIKTTELNSGPIEDDLITSTDAWINKIYSLLPNDSEEFEYQNYQETNVGHFLTSNDEVPNEDIFRSNRDDLITSTDAWINKIYSLLPNDSEEFEYQNYQETNVGHFLTSNDEVPNDQNYFPEIEEIRKEVPRRVYKYQFVDELARTEEERDQQESKKDHGIRIRKSQSIVAYTKQGQLTSSVYREPEPPTRSDSSSFISYDSDDDDGGPKQRNVRRYPRRPDFRRYLIKGSMRALRRKILPSWGWGRVHAKSPFFLDVITGRHLAILIEIYETILVPFKILDRVFRFSDLLYRAKRYWLYRADSDWLYSDWADVDRADSGWVDREREPEFVISDFESWDIYGQTTRSLLLLTQSLLRKYILLPSLIIAKNVARMLLFQLPEWRQDFADWREERHIRCTYEGSPLSETEFPNDWLNNGFQIKILYPFRLRPWRKSKVPSRLRDTTKKKRTRAKKKMTRDLSCFLTVWGKQAEVPFGPTLEVPSFFKPIRKELKKKIIKVAKRLARVLRISKKTKKKVSKIERRVDKKMIVMERRMKEKGKVKDSTISNKRFSKIERRVDKKMIVMERRMKEKGKVKDSTISNKITDELPQAKKRLNRFFLKKKRKILARSTAIIRNQIEQIAEDKKKIILTPDINISPNETNCADKNSELQKNIWQIFKRKSTRLRRKLYYFLKYFIERIYNDILHRTIKTLRTNALLFLESTKKTIKKFTSQKGIDQTMEESNINNENSKIDCDLSSSSVTIAKCNINNENSKIDCDLSSSSLSQAYVLYALSQVNNKYHLKSVLQYNGTHLFLKDRIKDYCGTRGLFDFKKKHKKVYKSGMNKWKNWLKNHHQYNLSQTQWSRLVPQKWRNRVSCTTQKKDSIILDSYSSKKRLNNIGFISYKNKKEKLIPYRARQKTKLKKNYKYDLLAHKYMNYEGGGDFYIYASPLQVNRGRKFPYIFNTQKTHKPEVFYVLVDIDLSDYLEGSSPYGKKNMDRKYFDFRMPEFCFDELRDTYTKKNFLIYTDFWIKMHIGIDINQYYEINQYYQLIYNRNLYPLATQNKKRKKQLYDWIGMRPERLPLPNLESWFFPEFVQPYHAYRIKPWFNPTEYLVLSFRGNKKKKISYSYREFKHKKRKLLESQKEKEVESQKEKKVESQKEKEVESQKKKKVESQKEKEVESQKEKKVESQKEKEVESQKKKKVESQKEKKALQDSLLNRFFIFQLRWERDLNEKILEDFKIYSLLLRLHNPLRIAISSIKRGQLDLELLCFKKGTANATELIKRGILFLEPTRLFKQRDADSLFLEPTRLFKQRDADFLIYQIIGISLINNNKQTTYGRYIYVPVIGISLINKNKQTDRRYIYVPEKILSTRRRRELRILTCFNSRKGNVVDVDRNLVFFNGNTIRNCGQFLKKDKHFNTNKNKLIKFKLFLWPNYRLEDLACMNRYWFDTNNGSHFSMLRIQTHLLNHSELYAELLDSELKDNIFNI